jgi:hypothetical protein
VPRGRRRVAVADEPDPSRPRQAGPQVKPEGWCWAVDGGPEAKYMVHPWRTYRSRRRREEHCVLRSELSSDCLDQEACTISRIDLSTETEGFPTKTDGPHTIGCAATDGFPRGLFIYHEHSSNVLFENPSAQLSERTVTVSLGSCRDLRTGSDPPVTSASASRSRCRVAGDAAD